MAKVARLCEVPGCGKPHRAKGKCGPCRLRERTETEPGFAEQRKETLLRWRASPGVIDRERRVRRDYRRNRYQTDKAFAETIRQNQRAYNEAVREDPAKYAERQARDKVYADLRRTVKSNRDRERETARYRNTGTSPELFTALWVLQRAQCAICLRALHENGNKKGSANADHYETVAGIRVPQKTPGATKHPRGILCHGCNVSLGIYELQQKPLGLVIAPYEQYLEFTPVMRLQQLPANQNDAEHK